MTEKQQILFNKPYIAGNELAYVTQVIAGGKIASDGHFTQQCSRFLEERFDIARVLMTPSCTAALEIAAQLCDLQPGDEVIMPSYTFVSTANAFMRVGAKPVFVEIRPDTLNLDESLIEDAITERTRVIVPVHYAGVGCEMERIMAIAKKHDLLVVEDAAQGVNAFYKGKALGSIGHLGCYSFHDTKNYVCGEGGALCINDQRFVERAEILRDKGTNRQQFFRGHVDKYTWVDVGSSFVPSEIACAFLYGQFELLDEISRRRKSAYEMYLRLLEPLNERGLIRLPHIPENCSSNYHMFYVFLPDEEARNSVLTYLNSQGIQAVFHYVPLHTAPQGGLLGYKSGDLPLTEDISGRLVRLPMYCELSNEDVKRVVEQLFTLA